MPWRTRPSPGYRTPTKEQSHFGCLLPQPADSRRVHFASNELRMSIDGNFTVSECFGGFGWSLETKKQTEIVLSAANSLNFD